MAVRNRPDKARFDAAIDSVCKQRDCAYSGLYWYTDLEAAKRAAGATGRPILSLRLLGNLDEELSCANSRYFRTLLYPNREIGAYLRANYILHWKSVRPAPVVTVDFGNGRKMRRSITGNSIHYVLDSNGRPLDAIPGLYAPPQFIALLREGVALHKAVLASKDGNRALRVYHDNVRWAARRRAISPLDRANEYSGTRAKRMAAWTSGSLAPSKGGGEDVMLTKVAFDASARGMLDDLSRRVREVVSGPSTLDENALALIRAKRAATPDPSMRTEEALEEAIERLEETLAADTKINEKLHAELHQWFVEGTAMDVETLNAQVYDRLFLAPGEDQWMGLAAKSSFTGILGEGLIVTAAR
ncbi:MAG TPA: hypothetical protein VEK57_03410 [Thermoanaerobaculia bacterium]|nr:hypothetical protein [Thermoanaerobaculia bacterium]